MTTATASSIPESLRDQREQGALLTGMAWVSFFVSVAVGIGVIGSGQPIEIPGWVRFDALAAVMAMLVTFVSAIVHSFARRYMDGDCRFGAFFTKLTGVTLLVLITVCADHIALLAASWLAMGLLLANLTGHVHTWIEARNAAALTRNSFLAGSVCLAGGLALLGSATGSWTITGIVAALSNAETGGLDINYFMAALLLLAAAMVQSAQWPLNRWLISSMNAPTPVSALMHAGMVNAGGFLLARFAPVFTASTELMMLVFAVGSITALLGTAWMLVQTDIKRSLGCSTMGQMGFMVMQCGLGLFTAAIAHLALHGLFKAALFLGAGSAVHDAPAGIAKPEASPKGLFGGVAMLLSVLIPALAAAVVFAQLTGKTLYPVDANTVLVAFALLAALQAVLTVYGAGAPSLARLIGMTLLLAAAAALYAGGFDLVHAALAALPMLSAPQSWTLLDTLVLLVFLGSWLVLALRLHAPQGDMPRVMRKLYVKLLNDSQPTPSGVTAFRSHYRPF
jgi:NAD(P)H-quinone oxidoreductase subunit 5